MIGRPIGKMDLCKCCGEESNKEKFKLFDHVTEYYIYGPIYTITFNFLKFAIFCLILTFLVNLVFSLSRNRYYLSCPFSSCD